MKALHVITVKYLGATNFKDPRIKLTSQRFKHDSITISYNYEFDNCYDIAINYLKDTHNIVAIGEGKKIDYILTDTFKRLRGAKS